MITAKSWPDTKHQSAKPFALPGVIPFQGAIYQTNLLTKQFYIMATINTISRKGIEMQVIFTGAQYIFTNRYYGVLAVATRTNKWDDEAKSFDIAAEDYHTVGGRLTGGAMEAIAAAYIRNAEQEFTPCEVNFTYTRNAGQTFDLEIKATPRS